jgi:lysyl endopeptidase
VSSAIPSGCTGSPGPLTQSCSYTPPPPSCMYTYSEWSACQPNNTRSRAVIAAIPVGCAGTPGTLAESCTYLAPASTENYTAMWWQPQEPGWGINVNHQDSTLFATLFSYSESGTPMWLMASSMARQADSSYFGDLYRVTGPVFNQTPWTQVQPTVVGRMTLSFSSKNTASLSYNVGSVTVSKQLERYSFGTPATCSSTTSSRAAATNYQDFWWNAAEPGWGLNLLHEGSVVFATLFSYDSTGTDMWLVASSLSKQADGSFSGSVFKMAGPSFATMPWRAATPREAGSMTLRFSSGETGVLSYTVDGVPVTKAITRHVFGAAVPVCK